MLIVEDDPAWQKLLTEVFEDLGFAVDRAADARAAIAMLRERAYALAVVDVSLDPEDHRNRGGFQVLDALAAHEPPIPAIALTGYATVEMAVEALTRHRAADFLRKETFQRRAFLEVVARLLRQERTSASRSPTALPALRQRASPPGPRVLVVEDDPGWQDLYQEILAELSLSCETAPSYAEALAWLEREAFAMLIVDLQLASSMNPFGNRDGLRLLQVARRRGLPTIAVSATASIDEVEMAYQSLGVFAFFDKAAFNRRTFLQFVQQALRGQPGPSAPRPTGSLSPEDQAALASLTPREREVLRWMAHGLTNREIAERLVVSPNTVKKQVDSILSKLGVHTRAAAVRKAILGGLVEEKSISEQET
ncbi:MAG: response regulator [Anaerolineae bacterium]|uniref:response regulator transcription factor n=1 Tax=Thermoflexus sp. TaxID=1969742 RepID=UPI0025F66AB7|nr:response regulator [Thermoflexus sp.]MDW8180264.1 response regulator [Anaerolineae bacterium]